MKVRTQAQAVEKLEKETRKSMRALEDLHANELLNLWFKTRVELQAIVAREYRQDFHGKDQDGRPERWHLAAASSRGTLPRIFHSTRAALDQFSIEAKRLIAMRLKDAYRHEALRTAWILDTTTPGSRAPKLPAWALRESAASPRDYKAGWDEALDAWLQSYQDTLQAALRMEAIHEGDLEDATQEVVKAKIDGHDPAAKFSALFTNQALQAQQDARDGVVAENPDLVLEEIWMTLEDIKVCPICEKYDGQPYADVDDEIPAHFNCRCYTRVVPAKWAALLGSGDAADRELALAMDDAGMVPDSMVVSGADGSLVAHFTVTFNDWLGGRAQELYGQNVAGQAGSFPLR